MRFVVEWRLIEPCPLSAAEAVTLATREWELVVGWLATGRALAHTRIGVSRESAVLVDVGSEAEARALAAALPFAPYATVSVRASAGAAPLAAASGASHGTPGVARPA
jgi:hypothetical protein